MKFRTDFVTNSSSTSYTTVTVNFKNGKSAKVDLVDEGIDGMIIHEAAPFLKDIKSVEKLAAYLTVAYDYNNEGTYVDEKPVHVDHGIHSFRLDDGSIIDKYFVLHSQEADNLVKYIEQLTIADLTDDKIKFIDSCIKNAKSVQDIMRITINERILYRGSSDSHVIHDAINRIANENNIDKINGPAFGVINSALGEGEYPQVKTIYNLDLENDKHWHKTKLRIETIYYKVWKPLIRIDKNFYSVFNSCTGEYFRSGIIKDGKDIGIDPFMASFPHLIDVGIMGHCTHGKTGLCHVGCYQSGSALSQPNMSLRDFKKIVRQCAGRVDQFALGGRGDPDQHEHFREIIDLCDDYGIKPNFTTSGYGLTPEIACECWRCGAVAVSWYRQDYTLRAIQLLLDTIKDYGFDTKINIHYVLGNSSIDEAIERLEQDDFPKGINAVIFLLHKPVGLGKQDDTLRMDDHRVKHFFELVDKAHPFKVGIDSCTTPGIINHCNSVALESIDTCEGARFSCYIGADMMMTPCSFDQHHKYAVSLRDTTIQYAWNSSQFEAFRNSLSKACPQCPSRATCMGGCPLLPQIVLCNKQERKSR